MAVSSTDLRTSGNQTGRLQGICNVVAIDSLEVRLSQMTLGDLSSAVV